MKDKICIATWYKSTNYGTCLQAYALKEIIRQMGFRVYMLESVKGFYKTPCRIHWFLLKVIRKLETVIRDFKRRKHIPSPEEIVKKKRINSFATDNFTCLDILNSDSFKKVFDEFACFISGGDQIWNPYYLHRKFLLDFIYKNKNIKKISYATSIGVTTIPLFHRKAFKLLWDDYDSIGVREESARKLIQDISGKKAQVTLDSTLLLNLTQWESFADTADHILTIESPYIFCYFVGHQDEYWDFVQKAQTETNYQIVSIQLQKVNPAYQNISEAGPKEFVDFIRKASFIITDSFHACAISIKFHKEFYVLKRFNNESNKSQNDRIYHLLEICSLTDRIPDQTAPFNRKAIDYDSVDKRLEPLCSSSIDFLKQNLLPDHDDMFV